VEALSTGNTFFVHRKGMHIKKETEGWYEKEVTLEGCTQGSRET
jgi:hypothetical protein